MSRSKQKKYCYRCSKEMDVMCKTQINETYLPNGNKRQPFIMMLCHECSDLFVEVIDRFILSKDKYAIKEKSGIYDMDNCLMVNHETLVEALGERLKVY